MTGPLSLTSMAKATFSRPAPSRLRRVVLTDHMRLPWRFFGRLAVCAQASL